MDELSLDEILDLEDVETEQREAVEAEIRFDDSATLMQTPPGPLKANCVGKGRPKSGPVGDDCTPRANG